MTLIPMIELYLSTLAISPRTEENQGMNSVFLFNMFCQMAPLAVNKAMHILCNRIIEFITKNTTNFNTWLTNNPTDFPSNSPPAFSSYHTLIRPPKSHSCPFPTTTHFRTQVPCTNKNSTADADLASGLATEVAKINTHLLQREEAMNKSRELLFTELCNYLALDKEEVKKKWSKIDQEERRVLIKGFVNEWDASFHPLSARSVKEMIEEYLHEEKPSPDSSRSTRFPGLKSIMGFSE